jgi:hypothetical protein
MAAGQQKTSAPAERMRLYRNRKRGGLRVVPLQVRESERKALVRMGLLAEGTREDRDAIAEAIYRFFDKHLVRQDC